jgi:hypothetical protein
VNRASRSGDNLLGPQDARREILRLDVLADLVAAVLDVQQVGVEPAREDLLDDPVRELASQATNGSRRLIRFTRKGAGRQVPIMGPVLGVVGSGGGDPGQRRVHLADGKADRAREDG